MSPATYRIKEIADRSGFTPPTLRYYEEIGLLPAPARTSSGYRTYDDTTLTRLAFIAPRQAARLLARRDPRPDDGMGRWTLRPNSGPAARTRQ